MNHRAFDKATEKKIAKRYQKGESLTQLAEAFDSNYGTVRLCVLRQGVELRKRGAKYQGNRTLNQHGYIYIRLPKGHEDFHLQHKGGYILEHRYFMAKHLGRALEDHESVHHIDGDRTNNSIDNLQIRNGKHGNGVVHVCINCGSNNIRSIELPA
tara:strand:- start:298 stop:762 length:465 start_codon:yes stop_codon:yes gene_type:complete